VNKVDIDGLQKALNDAKMKVNNLKKLCEEQISDDLKVEKTLLNLIELDGFLNTIIEKTGLRIDIPHQRQLVK